jgi:hypothetical protein
MVKIGFSETIQSQEEISADLTKWDFNSKLTSYGFVSQTDADKARNILGTIQQDQAILEILKELKNNITALKKQQDIIQGQSKEISSRISSHHYRTRRRCCPSLLKEMWHSVF